MMWESSLPAAGQWCVVPVSRDGPIFKHGFQVRSLYVRGDDGRNLETSIRWKQCFALAKPFFAFAWKRLGNCCAAMFVEGTKRHASTVGGAATD